MVVALSLDQLLLVVSRHTILVQQNIHHVYDLPPSKKEIGHFETDAYHRDAQREFVGHDLQILASERVYADTKGEEVQ